MKKRKRSPIATISVAATFILLTVVLVFSMLSLYDEFGPLDFLEPDRIISTQAGGDDDTDTDNDTDSDTDTDSDSDSDSDSDDPITDETPWLLKSTSDAGDEYFDNVYFLGDSTTYGLLAYASLPGGKKDPHVWFGSDKYTIALFNVKTVKLSSFGFPDGQTSKLTIAEAASAVKPEILVITLGINGLSSLSRDAFIQYFSYVVETVLSYSPDTTIVLQSIFPIGREGCNELINNERVILANSWISDYAKTCYESDKKVYFLDTYPSLLNENGYLKPEFDNGSDDHIHLNADGLRAVLLSVRTHTVPLDIN